MPRDSGNRLNGFCVSAAKRLLAKLCLVLICSMVLWGCGQPPERDQLRIYLYAEYVGEWSGALTQAMERQVRSGPLEVRVFPFAEALVTTHMAAREADLYLLPHDFWQPLLGHLGLSAINDVLELDADRLEQWAEYMAVSEEQSEAQLLAIPVDADHAWFRAAGVETWERWLAVVPGYYQHEELLKQVLRYLIEGGQP